jgi:DNA (cytosine-5)-methyltransferase 1
MKSIELFAGAGGLGMGLSRAGFRPVDVVEWDRWCCETLVQNVREKAADLAGWKISNADVRTVDFSRHAGKIQLVSGGPPCQPFSLGGKHKAYADGRDMFPEAIRAVRECQPRAFVFENVKGLTRSAFRNYFEYIRLQLEHPEVIARADEDWSDHLSRLERHHLSASRNGLHYRVVTRLLNAADFGVPQKRERVFIVGFRDDLNVEWNFPEPSHSQDALIWAQCNSNEYWERHKVPKSRRIVSERVAKRAGKFEEPPQLQPWRTVRDAIGDLPEPRSHSLGSQSHLHHFLQPGARSYPGHTGSPVDEPAKTLKAGVHGVPGGENMLARPDGSVRYFSVRESARLQTFPDDFQFHGSWSEIMRQLGNAVPVRLAETIGKGVRAKLRAA